MCVLDHDVDAGVCPLWHQRRLNRDIQQTQAQMSETEEGKTAPAINKRDGQLPEPQRHTTDTRRLERPLLRQPNLQPLQRDCRSGLVRRAIQAAEGQITVSMDCG